MEKNVKNCMEFLRPRQTNVGTDVNVHATGFVSASPVRLSSQMKTDLPIHASSDRKYQCGHVSIRVYEADILSVPVACIVNAENGDLQQGYLYQMCKTLLYQIHLYYTVKFYFYIRYEFS